MTNCTHQALSSDREDTIAAFSTALGGPIAIVRISGPAAARVADEVWHGAQRIRDGLPRGVRLGKAIAAQSVLDDQVLAVFMPGPASYTGEDMVELHCHGGALGARLVLLALLEAGARHADPGEFTRRAFVNGKMDLTQSEAVMDVIGAHTEAALRIANHQLQGHLRSKLNTVYDELIFLLSEVEGRLDFPEEDLQWVPQEQLAARVDTAAERIWTLRASENTGEVLRNGVRLVIAGPPNVGKSSLMNAILGRDRAIVTHIPGTTRDTLEELAHVRGIPVRLTDTAGIRDSDDLVEQTGIERSLASLEDAEVILWIVDATRPREEQAPPQSITDRCVITVANKQDLLPSPAPPLARTKDDLPIPTCAITGDGLEQVFDAVEQAVWQTADWAEPDVAVSARHAALLTDATPALKQATQHITGEDWELAAICLRTAIDCVGQITGRTATPDILDNIFARFCIGK
ncbi:MAG: tRNA uridine-5-carboxymethylaminomethyl(34) synthesis GTPase MnmE [Lentisphaerae bacterium]|nr:tRNA uridine-5-carboxymethylaminomethyl(34) synthesis GTPase MnmE [Lentisphaerota bacterium]MBT4815617.1 tRNA uridine-5-carboxymethylaminomethyl(34) synthesis GTPase MnmE [Lentisphaerota bacterium]MBT5607460.1 tRNA uridine-5-carboxymethylaminomethyl(34) synthesis GTPase MnmE [Lentisphaerota bacterium]MBT7055740.1 tRNA uridine-5-carboxymethylaminomethyl(34) synthesis GTPase MnmE [Lentisphaerota bacterium]MBT7843125.1 tRNA uridine-5-carboxymethylaminomethyl(34) synthesis GTPase MnmE [Lentispha